MFKLLELSHVKPILEQLVFKLKKYIAYNSESNVNYFNYSGNLSIFIPLAKIYSDGFIEVKGTIVYRDKDYNKSDINLLISPLSLTLYRNVLASIGGSLNYLHQEDKYLKDDIISQTVSIGETHLSYGVSCSFNSMYNSTTLISPLMFINKPDTDYYYFTFNTDKVESADLEITIRNTDDYEIYNMNLYYNQLYETIEYEGGSTDSILLLGPNNGHIEDYETQVLDYPHSMYIPQSDPNNALTAKPYLLHCKCPIWNIRYPVFTNGVMSYTTILNGNTTTKTLSNSEVLVCQGEGNNISYAIFKNASGLIYFFNNMKTGIRLLNLNELWFKEDSTSSNYFRVYEKDFSIQIMAGIDSDDNTGHHYDQFYIKESGDHELVDYGFQSGEGTKTYPAVKLWYGDYNITDAYSLLTEFPIEDDTLRIQLVTIGNNKYYQITDNVLNKAEYRGKYIYYSISDWSPAINPGYYVYRSDGTKDKVGDISGGCNFYITTSDSFKYLLKYNAYQDVNLNTYHAIYEKYINSYNITYCPFVSPFTKLITGKSIWVDLNGDFSNSNNNPLKVSVFNAVLRNKFIMTDTDALSITTSDVTLYKGDLEEKYSRYQNIPVRLRLLLDKNSNQINTELGIAGIFNNWQINFSYIS